MTDPSRKRLRRATIIYWSMLLYIIAALVWWFIILEKQNRQMGDMRYKALQEQTTTLSLAETQQQLEKIDADIKRNSGKYLAEGITFLILILIGAAFVYRSVRRQFNMQQQQQHFMMAVTHELKTPVSVARLNLETIQKYSLDPDKEKKLIRNTLEEIARLNALTNNILISSQLEGGGYRSTREELDLSYLLKDCINDFRSRFPERMFTENIEPDTELKGDPLLIQMLFNNLLENAIKYSPKESPVGITVVKKDTAVIVEITDEGPGIPDEEKSKIFTRFYRIGNENTRKTQGTGLGLYLCSRIAADHNADISVTNHSPRGSKFAVTFYT